MSTERKEHSSERSDDGRYTNLDGTTPDKSLLDIVKWQWGERRSRRERSKVPFHPPWRENDGKAVRRGRGSLTFVGHATWVQWLGGKVAITDPIWAAKLATITRATAPGLTMENLPNVDVVTVSHSHRDHLDVPTLRSLGPQITYVVPKGVGAILKRAGLPRVVELDWWETHHEGDLAISLVPAQHWSMRMPWDRNKTLWGGFVYRGGGITTYHAGDTAFNGPVFEAIRERFPDIDYAMLPIGAYDPVWFMGAQHMGPEDAARAWEILGARTLVAMHWGTFKLTDEPLAEPPVRLLRYWTEKGIDPSRLWILDMGETRPLRTRDAVSDASNAATRP